MAWFLFSLANKPLPTNANIRQQSHLPLNVAPEDSDIAHTLDQLATGDSQPQVLMIGAKTNKELNQLVTNFVLQRPKNMFVIDGEKHANESIICTSDERGNKTCLHLRYNLIELFKQMQKLEYFCSLPNDIDATYFECRKIN